jgi:hypothetical protein
MSISFRSLIFLATLSIALAGCSVLSPAPVWELIKATGSVATYAIADGPSKARDTVFHEHPSVQQVCIEMNAQTQLVDVIPALQAEFRTHGIESRVYEPGSSSPTCKVWLHYSADMRWDIPLFGTDYKPYMNTAALTLRSETGDVLSSSSYALDDFFDMGKWASTRSKLAPVVTALLTGFEH